MNISALVALFFAGALLCNSIPHLVSGLQGRPFPSPFARPHGIGDSTPLVNFYWGMLNLVAGLAIMSRHRLAFEVSPGAIAMLAGALAIGSFAAIHFGKVQAKKREN